MMLPGPKRDYALNLNLRLVETMEQEGSLMDLAENLTAGRVKQEDLFLRLKIVYQAAGCLLPLEALRRFLAEDKPPPILAEVLLGILTPLLKMGAVLPGEERAARRGG